MFVARNHVHSRAPAIEEALQAAIAKVRSDSEREDWVLCGFQGGDDIRLIGTGVGGVEALKQSIVQWDVCYGLVRCSHTLEQAGYVQTDFIKFVWVYWRPDNIPVMRKMRIGVNEGEMKSLFAPYHAELQACTIHELGEKPLADVLDSVTMRADRTSGTRKLERSPSSPTLLARGRAAWKLARSSLPSMHFAHLAIADEQKKVAASTRVEIEKPEAFAKAVRAVRSDISFADWCLVGYKNDNVLRMVGTGKGGLDALLDAAEPYGVNYGLLRMSEKFDLVYHEAYCFITWMPENIPAFAKARVSTHQGAVAAIFRNHVHCQFYFRGADRSDITMEVIRNRVRQIIGKGERPRRSSKNKTTTATATGLQAAVGGADDAPAMVSRGVAPISEQSPFPEEPSSAAAAAAEDDEEEGTTEEASDDSSMVVSPASQATAATAADEEEEIARPVYIAPKTNTNSLRGSIVIKADVLKKARSPSEEEKSNFPRMFLNSLTKGASASSSSSRAPRGETKSSRPGGETKTMDMAAMAEAKARDSPLQQPPKPQAAPSVLTSVQEAVRRVRMGGDGADFLVVEWRQGAGTLGSQQQEQLEIKEIGTGGAQALADCLEQNSIMYGLVRVTETTEGRKDGREGNGKEKFCCVKWAPEDGTAPQRTPELQGEVSRLFHPYHGDLTAKHAAEVTPEAVNSRVAGRLKQ